MLAVCNGGGNDAAAWLFFGIVFLLWLIVAAVVVKTARDRSERSLLIILMVVSILLGPALFFGLTDGFSGSGDDLGNFLLSLLIPGAVGAGIALWTRSGHGGKAFFISAWGALLLTGGFFVLLIAFLAIGGGCLD